MNLMSSTLLLEDTDIPFDELQAEQIEVFRDAWQKAGRSREPRVSIEPQRHPDDLGPRPPALWRRRERGSGRLARRRDEPFGRSYTGEPDKIAEELAADEAVRATDTLLLTVPSQLGVDYNTALLDTIAREIAPAIGWSPKNAATAA